MMRDEKQSGQQTISGSIAMNAAAESVCSG